jgi:hypothetical protein
MPDEDDHQEQLCVALLFGFAAALLLLLDSNSWPWTGGYRELPRSHPLQCTCTQDMKRWTVCHKHHGMVSSKHACVLCPVHCAKSATNAV